MRQPTTPNTTATEQTSRVIPQALADQLAEAIRDALDQTRQAGNAYGEMLLHPQNGGSDHQAAEQAERVASLAVFRLLYANTAHDTPAAPAPVADGTQY